MIIGNIETDLETLRDAFLVKSERMFLQSVEGNSEYKDKFRETVKMINNMSYDVVKQVLEAKLNRVECGLTDESEIEKIEYEIALILSMIPLDIKDADKYWSQKRKEITQDELCDENVLIEVAAMHPLIDGKPAPEFEKRLLEAIKIYKKEIERGSNVIIYVPGSIHSIQKDGEWQTDAKPLSLAGKEYLIEHGIPEGAIKAEEANQQYKNNGVYNSADECFVASCIARDNKCGRVISIASPVQIYRKALLYTEFGYTPEMYGVALKETAHNYIGEIFWSLYITYAKDHSWQEGFLKEKTRQEREKNYIITSEIQQILDDGIIIPDVVKQKRQEWLEKYNSIAKSSDEQANIAVYVDYDGEKALDAISDIIQDEDRKRSVTICAKTPEQLSEIITGLKLDVKGFVTTTDDLCKRVKSGEFSDLYCICSSENSILNAVRYIERGAKPIIVSLPTEKDDYVSPIRKLYEEVIYKERNKDCSQDR